VADAFDDAMARGAQLFDAGAFFQAHEAWEERWQVETDPDARLLLQGLIQIAAGFHKVLGGNAPRVDSAGRLFARGLAKLDACPRLVAERRLVGFGDGVRDWARALTGGTVDRATIPRLA
jgi:predicted metal-dependent hydrolase